MRVAFSSMAWNRLQLAGRAADNLQYFRGRCLLLQRLAQIIGALTQLVEQARVLDGDDGLIGEIRDEFDLLVSEGADLCAIDGDSADEFVILEHRRN